MPLGNRSQQRRYLRLLFLIVLAVICWCAYSGTTGGEYLRVFLDFQLQPGHPHPSGSYVNSHVGDFGAGQEADLGSFDSSYRSVHDDESAGVGIVMEEEEEPSDYAQTRVHVWRDDGLVEVNPFGPHPIFELMERAEKEWNDKLERASKTLGEAIREYRRRYRRNPPRGFDKWWAYVQRHEVLLPDEYDAIYEDLEPFWGLDPVDLQQIHTELEFKKDSYTIGKEADLDKIRLLKTSFRDGMRHDDLLVGSKGILDLLGDIQDELPPFRATFSPHDNPNKLNDYGVLSTLLEAASVNEPIPKSDLPLTRRSLYWRSACSPNTPARQLPKFDLDEPVPKLNSSSPSSENPKTFIYNHKLSMDPCLHPSHFWQHGQFLAHHYGPEPQPHPAPEFSLCATTLHGDIRYPSPYMWVEDVSRNDDPEWDDKIDERLGWRGTTTGIYADDPGKMRWRAGHRYRPIKMSAELGGEIEVLMSYPDHKKVSRDENHAHGYEEERQRSIGQPKRFKKSIVNPALFDLAFAGEPNTCEASTCNKIASSYTFRPRQSSAETFQYKYLLDMDGNGWSGRFKRLITSNSLVFKATIYPEWFVDRIQPWVHYVPVQMGMEDLYDAFMFFRGDACGSGGHPELAKKIASQGRQWSKRFWRREDLVAYFYRLMLEYTRVMSLDRAAMTMPYNMDMDMDVDDAS